MHKLLFDQNLSYKIIKQIEHISLAVLTYAFLSSIQLMIYLYGIYAAKYDFTIVTQDTDFDAISMLNGYPPKIIRVNTGNTATQTIIELLLVKTEIMKDFLNNDAIGLLELE